MTPLLNHRMTDGSREFADLPYSRSWDDVRVHASTLPAVRLTGFITDGIFEAWIDFSYAGHSFSINNQFAEYWLVVINPACPREVLVTVKQHFERLLGSG
jgi:hypothetical protein